MKQLEELENHKKKEIISKKYDLRNVLIGILVTALISSIGYIIKEYYENKKVIETNDLDKHKELYKEGSNLINEIIKSYQPIINYLSTNYGSTSIELNQNKIDALFKVRTLIENYKKDLRKYSTYEFINTIENIEHIVIKDYIDIELVRLASINIEDKITRIIYDPLNKDKPKITEKTLEEIEIEIDKDLDEYIKYENSLYFKFRDFSIPLIEALENIFNSPYRKKLGLDSLDNNDNINNLIQEWSKYKYTNKEFNYQISRMRIYSVATTIMQGESFKIIDDQIKKEIMIKYLIYVINKNYSKEFNDKSQKN
ncbi:hypothetical protein [Aliarcobacter butzleri]|uniref:hypothetical protein n=1 Tax=Aliarcobacter butzleri TaxID=28197 RepID=UPI001EDC2486|nr:hypothetical protein [Aliarcobacter butzleri]MCG3690335.1 hypothetical protein [Aliarcobacter butzleri]